MPLVSTGSGDGRDPLAEMIERAYAGEAEGAFAYASDDTGLRVSVLLRPKVPMGQVIASPAVAALGVLDGLESLGVDEGRIGIAWPHDIVSVDGHRLLARVTTKAGYGEGIFVVACVELGAGGEEGVASSLCEALLARMRAWSEAIAAGRAQAGPWAPFLSEYFDRVVLMGKPVDVCYPNGTVYARGFFVGVDVWGHATVRTRRAGDLEFPPERFRIEPQS